MESGECCEGGASPLPVSEGSSVDRITGSGVCYPHGSETEWHSIPLEDPLRPEMEYCFHLLEGRQSPQQASNVDLSLCGLSKFIGVGHDDAEALVGYTASDSKRNDKYVNVESTDALSGVKEVRLSIHGLEDPKKGYENTAYKSENKAGDDSGSILGHGDEGCLPSLQQVRAFIKGAKLSCSGLLSGDGKTFLSEGWGYLLQRSFSFRSMDTSPSETESLFKKSSNYVLSRTSTAPPVTEIPGIGATDILKGSCLQGRDPQSRADALPLAHYRPIDGAGRKDGDEKAGLPVASVAASNKSPLHANCKKPPKPPRHPGRSSSLDSAALAAQRSAKKKRDRVPVKRKSRSASAASTTGLSPFIALVLTIGFGILVVFQGVFVQTNASYGRINDRTFVDAENNLRTSIPTRKTASFDNIYQREPQILASSNVHMSKDEAALIDTLHKSMEDLPWSRRSLGSHMKSDSG